jgi:hypothetical protein
LIPLSNYLNRSQRRLIPLSISNFHTSLFVFLTSCRRLWRLSRFQDWYLKCWPRESPVWYLQGGITPPSPKESNAPPGVSIACMFNHLWYPLWDVSLSSFYLLFLPN